MKKLEIKVIKIKNKVLDNEYLFILTNIANLVSIYKN